MPIFTYRCNHCGRVEERIELVPREIAPASNPTCPCWADGVPEIMLRIPSASNFYIAGFSEKNGYSK